MEKWKRQSAQELWYRLFRCRMSFVVTATEYCIKTVFGIEPRKWTMNSCWIFCKLSVLHVDFIHPAWNQWQSDIKIDDLAKPNVTNKFGKHNNMRGKLVNFQQTTFYKTILYYIQCGCVIIWCMGNYLWVEAMCAIVYG